MAKMTEEDMDLIVSLCHQKMSIYPGEEYNYEIVRRGMEKKSMKIIDKKLKYFFNKYKEQLEELKKLNRGDKMDRLEFLIESRANKKEFVYDLEILAIEITFYHREVIKYYGFYNYSED